MAEDPKPTAETRTLSVNACPDCLQGVRLGDTVVVRGWGVSSAWHRTCLKRSVDARVAELGQSVEDACRKDPVLAGGSSRLTEIPVGASPSLQAAFRPIESSSRSWSTMCHRWRCRPKGSAGWPYAMPARPREGSAVRRLHVAIQPVAGRCVRGS